jgi:hypothetical protein
VHVIVAHQMQVYSPLMLTTFGIGAQSVILTCVIHVSKSKRYMIIINSKLIL